MKTLKLTSLVLAGLMTVQSSFAFATTDRTAGIGEQQAAVAKKQIADLRTQLLTMDTSLSQTAMAIQAGANGSTGDKIGLVTAGLVAVTAGAGVAHFAMSKMVGLQGLAAAQGLILGSSVSLGMALTSLVSSLIGASELPSVQTEKLLKEISQMQTDILNAAGNTKDPYTLNRLNQLQLSLLQVENTMAGYTKDQSSSNREKLLASLAIATGSAIVFMGHQRSNPGIIIKGSLISVGAGLARIAVTLEPSDVEEILVEIGNTRQILANALVSLKN